ncbi:MAG: hypothetical protein KA319_14285 [Ferruginibacter sp.]|nr:hypothetical protein [Ferruginibacter sp.]
MKKGILSVVALLTALIVTAQTEWAKSRLTLNYGLRYDYIFSSQKTNTSSSNTLFGGNGHSVGFRYGRGFLNEKSSTNSTDKIKPMLGFAFDLGFQFGKTSTKDLEAFAKSLTAPVSYKIAQSSVNWKQVVIMGGPMLRLGKRNNGLQPIEVSATAGAALKLKPRNIIIDKYDGQAKLGTVFNTTEKGTLFAWQANVSVPFAKLSKRLNLCLEAGYGFNGGTVGVTFRLGKRNTGL